MCFLTSSPASKFKAVVGSALGLDPVVTDRCNVSDLETLSPSRNNAGVFPQLSSGLHTVPLRLSHAMPNRLQIQNGCQKEDVLPFRAVKNLLLISTVYCLCTIHFK